MNAPVRQAPRVLVIEHETDCPPGWVGEWLAAAGCTLDVRRPYRGDELPADLTEHRGLLVLGGSMDAYADAQHPWLTRTKALVRGAVEDGTPTLGICLGHQLIAVALGGEVHRNPLGQKVGVPAVGWLPAAATDPLLAALTPARIAVQWNSDVVRTLPAGAQVLARSEHGEIQAARFAPSVWGVQWHPEAGQDIVRRWADGDRDAARERGIDVDEYVAHVAAAEPQLRAMWQPLASGFAGLCRSSEPEIVSPW